MIAQHYEWAHTYGVDAFFASWAGAGSFSDTTIRDDLLPSPARGPTQVALLYESLEQLGIGPDARIQLDATKIAKLVSDFDYIARTYFGDPGYYRIDGRPVVVLYASRIYRGPVAEAIHAIRSHLEAAYGVDPYLIGDEVDWDTAPDPARIGLYDAITGYTAYSRTQDAGWPSQTQFLQAVGRRVAAYHAVAAAEGVAFVPDALPGFNDRGVRLGRDHHVLPRRLGPSAGADSLFTESLDAAGPLVDPSRRSAHRHVVERVAGGHADRADRSGAAEQRADRADPGLPVRVVRHDAARGPRRVQAAVGAAAAAARPRRRLVVVAGLPFTVQAGRPRRPSGGVEESPDTAGQDAPAREAAKADGKWHREQTAGCTFSGGAAGKGETVG